MKKNENKKVVKKDGSVGVNKIKKSEPLKADRDDHKPSAISKEEEDLKKKADEAFSNPELIKQINSLKEGMRDSEYLEGAKAEDVLPGVNLSVIQLNRSASSSMHLFTLNVIRVGEVLIFLKKLVRRENGEWGVYAKENLKNVSERTLQKWMALANCKFAREFAQLGVERLYYLIQALKGRGEKDIIGRFLTKHNIKFDPEENFDTSVKEFKKAVDVALVLERAEQEKVNLDPEKVKRTVSAIGRLNDADWDRINFIKLTGGDANVFLEKAHANATSPKVPKKKKGNKGPVPFSKIAEDLKAFTSLAKAEEEYADKLDLNEIDRIIEQLQELRNLIVTV